MFARLACAALLCGTTLHVNAAVTTYEFDGYISAKIDGPYPESSLPSALFGVGTRFTGTIVVDPERTKWDWEWNDYVPDPVIQFTLQTESGATFSANGGWSSGYSVQQEDGGEQVGMGLTGDIQTSAGPYFGTAGLAWHSPTQGQTNPDVSQLDPTALQPNHWRLSIFTMSAQCAPECGEGGNVRGEVTSFRREGSSADDYATSFDSAPSGWSNIGGNWAVDAGTYRNAANTALTASINTSVSLGSAYDLYSTLYTQWSGTGNTLGLVFNYQDAANFDEVRFNAAGTATLNRIRNGARSTLRTAQYAGGARTWFPVRVNRVGALIRVWVGDAQIFEVDGGTPIGNFAGVFASWNQARFDEFRISQSSSWETTTHEFSSTPPAGWSTQSGVWSVSDGYYYSSTSLPAAIATTTATVGDDYAVNASIYLEWSNRGNRGGLVYDYQDASNYRAALFNLERRDANDVTFQDGLIEVIEVRGGVRRVVVPTSDPTFTRAKEWHAMGIRRIGNATIITVNGRTVAIEQPVVAGPKRVGLIASYNKVRFDDVIVGEPR